MTVLMTRNDDFLTVSCNSSELIIADKKTTKIVFSFREGKFWLLARRIFKAKEKIQIPKLVDEGFCNLQG